MRHFPDFLTAIVAGLFFVGWGIYGIRTRRIFWTGGTPETGNRADIAGLMFVVIGIGFNIAAISLLRN